MAPHRGAENTSALVQAALGGDFSAYGALIERHFSAVFVIALARLRDRDMAEDLAQEVFLRAQLHLGQLSEADRFEGWICRMTRNLAIDWLRRGQRASRLLPMVPLDELASEIPDTAGKGAREIVAANERSQSVRDAIMDLPAEQREVVLLHFTEELTQMEIAARLGVNQGTVSRQLHRALRALRSALVPALREAAPAFKPTGSAMAKSLAIALAIGAMSTSSKTALAASAAVGQWTSVAETAQAAAVGAAGVIGFLKSLPAVLMGGMKIMATAKGAVATIAAVATITAGGLYMKTHGQPSDVPAAQVPQEQSLPSTPGAYVRGDSGQWITLLETDPDAIQQIWQRSRQGEDVEAVFAEMNLPVIPRVQEMIVVAPDLEWSWDETFQGGGFRLADMEAQELETSAEDLGTGAGPWRVTFEPRPEGDALVMGWVDVSEGPQRMWMARLERSQATSLSPIMNHEGVFVEMSDGNVLELPRVSREQMEALMARLTQGRAVGPDAPALPTVAHLSRVLVLQPPSWYNQPNYGPGDGYDVAFVASDGSSRSLGAQFHDSLAAPGLLEIVFEEPRIDGILVIARGNFSQGEAEIWAAWLMGRVLPSGPP